MTIVVGYTPSPEGLAALEYATTAAVKDSARLVVVNTGVRGSDADPAFASQMDLDALSQRLQARGVDHEVRQVAQAESAAEEILKTAAAVSAGLIVIGLRRRTPVGKLILGSNSQQILLEADCPVAAVKRA